MDSLITKIQLLKNKAINKEILEDDKIKNSFMNINDKPITAFNNKKDFKLAKTLEEALFIISPNSFNEKSVFHIGLSINKNNDQEQSPCQACSQEMNDDN